MNRITDSSGSPMSYLEPVPIARVEVGDSLLGERMETNRTVSMPHQYEECLRTGRIDNFRIAAGCKRGSISGHLAPDSDVYKWVEAVSYALDGNPDTELFEIVNQITALIAAAQEESGYINTSFIFTNEKRRWTDLDHGHELYCGGHLIQAALAHYRSTGREELFQVACQWADYICGLFGPGKRAGTGGHPEVEMALVELFRETGEEKYRDLAGFFLEQRGKTPPVLDGSPYIQDHRPIREQNTLQGHAVRQLYLLCGVTDYYAETGQEELLHAAEKQWLDLTKRKMAITGGAGARYAGESFGLPYEIPNRTGYYETCAAIASFMWNWRMLLITGEARFADVMERTLYNGLLSGVALNGLAYFYTNPLEHDGEIDVAGNYRGTNERTSAHWDHTACCPPNMARLLASLPGYIYGKKRDELYIHHYLAGNVQLKVKERKVEITQKTEYPWKGSVELGVDTDGPVEFELKLRIPGWADSAEVEINGEPLQSSIRPGNYSTIRRIWKPNDSVYLKLPMPVHRIRAHPRVANNAGRVALMRGPIVYCIEQTDHLDTDLFSLVLPEKAGFEVEDSELLGGIHLLRGEGVEVSRPQTLYSRVSGTRGKSRELTAVPYYTWANREPGAMRVWIPTG